MPRTFANKGLRIYEVNCQGKVHEVTVISHRQSKTEKIFSYNLIVIIVYKQQWFCEMKTYKHTSNELKIQNNCLTKYFKEKYKNINLKAILI